MSQIDDCGLSRLQQIPSRAVGDMFQISWESEMKVRPFLSVL